MSRRETRVDAILDAICDQLLALSMGLPGRDARHDHAALSVIGKRTVMGGLLALPAPKREAGQ